MDEFDVQVTGEAVRDLEDLCEYVAEHDCAQASDYVYERIKAAILNLAAAPLRGRVIPELEGVGVLD